MKMITSKELYKMNGGDKLYIYKDGFGDEYNATSEEEDEWKRELIAETLEKIKTEENGVSLEHAIATLHYHHYGGLQNLLIQTLNGTSLPRQIALATALWTFTKYENSFDIICDILEHHPAECLNECFMALNKFPNHTISRVFIVGCLKGNVAEKFGKAQRTLTMWAYSGMAELREDKLLEDLKFENKDLPLFQHTITRIKEILNIHNPAADEII